MCKEEMEMLRERLNKMIASGTYNEQDILKISKELDGLIVQFMNDQSNRIMEWGDIYKRI